jgi:hypothetical protein
LNLGTAPPRAGAGSALCLRGHVALGIHHLATDSSPGGR